MGKTYIIVPISKMFESFKIETKELLDWDLINKFYEIETMGYKKVFPNNSLYSILVNQF